MRKLLSFMSALMLILMIPLNASASTMSIEAEQHILNELRHARIPNAAVAIVQGSEVSYILKDSTPDTLFSIQSVAKPFTAFGVLLLDDMGLLSLGDPVSKHPCVVVKGVIKKIEQSHSY